MPFLPIRRRPAPLVYRLPAGQRVYAVGDVHGRDDCLAAMADRIGADLARRPPEGEATVVFLGDYIDRGPASSAVVERLAGRRFAGLPARALLGNHEDALLRFLGDPVGAAGWLDWGGRETLASYGIDAAETLDGAALRGLAVAAAEAIPTRHLAFLRDLELSIVLGDYLFVHAGIRPGVALERQRRADLLWMRDPFLGDARPHPHRVVHGHTISDEVELMPNRIGVDTGAFATGRLSAVVIEDDEATVLPLRGGRGIAAHPLTS